MLSVPLVIEKIYRNRVLAEINKKKLTRSLYKVGALRKKMNVVAGKKLKETFGGHLRLFCIGGSALAGDVEMFLQEAKFPYSMGYGLTETSPLVTGTDNFLFSRSPLLHPAFPGKTQRRHIPPPYNIFLRWVSVLFHVYRHLK